MKTAKYAILLALIVTAVFLKAFAAEEAQSAKPKERVNFQGDHIMWQKEDDQSVFTLTGNVVVTYKDMTLTADKAVCNKKTNIVVADGNIKIVDSEHVITGEKATAYLNERRSVIEGNVKLVARPKEDAAGNQNTVKSKLKKPATITCDTLDYLYRKKIATAEGNLKIVQAGRTLFGKKGVYDVNQEMITLTGGVKVTDEEGQTFTSPGTVKASLKDGAEWIESDKGSATVNIDIDAETGGAQ